ncbi:hypothetical protein [Acinetobacter towneri]|uniref:hypothetical protein n=1 Tax=Acinetobacter towneri TaxID=202956 RepID=UPI001F2D21EE|nr:hypothetical protein [Acinetobacter towneri]UIP25996.1 hypothetical protein LZG54_04710 [Acinetobacter towneri]
MTLEITGDNPNKSYAFLNQFEDESYVWMTEIWLYKIDPSEEDILNFFITQATLKNLKIYLKNQIKELNQEDLKTWDDCFKESKIRFLPAEHLKTFQQNKRLNWFAIHILASKNEKISFRNLKFSDPYFYLLYLIYIKIRPFRLDEFIEELLKIRKKFNEILEEKNNLNKYIEDPNFIEWAYSYIQSHRNIRRDCPNVMRFPLDSLQNKKDYILSVFDFNFYNPYHERAQYLLAISSLKKAWQQKMFRDKGSVKQPYHIPLTKTAKSELKKLAEFKNKTEGILLSELIHEAYLKEMCDENGKALY